MIKNKTSQKHTFILVSIFKLLQFGHYHLAVTILSKLPYYPQLLLIFSLSSPHFSFLFIFTYFYIWFCFDDTKLKLIVIDMILICVSSLLKFIVIDMILISLIEILGKSIDFGPKICCPQSLIFYFRPGGCPSPRACWAYPRAGPEP